MTVTYDFGGQVAMVTGASAGMGAARLERSPRPAPSWCSPTST